MRQSALSCPNRYKFEGRSRNPAKDEFNTLLNYAYGILYSKVEKACTICRLGAFNSFLDESIRYGGRNIKRGDIIQFECHKIANQFVG